MNPLMSFAVLLLGIHLVSVSSAYYEPATYSREEEEVPAPSYKNYVPKEEKDPASSYYNSYVPKDQQQAPPSTSYNTYVPKEQQEVPASSSYKYDPKDHDDKDQDSPLDDQDQHLEGVFSLTLPTLLSDHYAKKPSEDEDYSLSSYYYYQRCPEFESIVSRKVEEWVGKDETLAAALLRLHFHDCAVRVR